MKKLLETANNLAMPPKVVPEQVLADHLKEKN
jgi:hypothetical protein